MDAQELKFCAQSQSRRKQWRQHRKQLPRGPNSDQGATEEPLQIRGWNQGQSAGRSPTALERRFDALAPPREPVVAVPWPGGVCRKYFQFEQPNVVFVRLQCNIFLVRPWRAADNVASPTSYWCSSDFSQCPREQRPSDRVWTDWLGVVAKLGGVVIFDPVAVLVMHLAGLSGRRTTIDGSKKEIALSRSTRIPRSTRTPSLARFRSVGRHITKRTKLTTQLTNGPSGRTMNQTDRTTEILFSLFLRKEGVSN
jgi:hypothetical protein